MSAQVELIETEPWTREEFKDKATWLQGRRFGIGASEASAVLGLSPWKSALSLYAEKIGLAEPDDAENEAMEWGLLLEPIIAEKYARATGRRLATAEPWTFYRSKPFPFMTASFDRLILGDPRGRGVLQIKAVNAFKADEWEAEPPELYQIQTQQEMAVAGATWGSLAVLIGGQRFRWFDMTRNDRFLAVLVEREADFWNRCMAQDPPTADGSVASREALRRMYPTSTAGKVVDLPREAEAWDATRLDAIARIKAAEREKDEAENQLRAAIGDAEVAVLPNGTTYTYKSSERKGYVVDTTISRTLRRKEMKG